MKRRLSSAVILPVAIVVLAGCLARPNPRIASITKDPADEDDPNEELTFSYDGSNRVEEVERVEGDVTHTWSLTWDASTLVKVVIKEDDGTDLVETAHDLTYEGGRLVRVDVDRDGETTDTIFSYDDQGRLARIEAKTDERDSDTTFEYGSDGLLEKVDNEQTEDDVTRSGSLEFSRGDGVLGSLTLDQEGSEAQSFEYSFDDETKQLAQITLETETQVNDEPTVVKGFFDFNYDDEGRVESVEQTAEIGALNVDVATVDVEYEEGDASALDLSSNEVFLLGIFFDMKGAHHGTFDNTTTVPRMAFNSW